MTEKMNRESFRTRPNPIFESRSVYVYLRHFKVLLYFILMCTLYGCSDSHRQKQNTVKDWLTPNGKIKVLSTTAIINDLVRQVGGDYVDTHSLIQGNLDPHSYQLVKGDDEKLNAADIIFHNGLGLEHGPSLRRYLLQDVKAVSIGDQIDLANPSDIIYVNGQKDPHIWMDVAIWSKAVPIIANTLSQRDPEHSLEYHQNAHQLIDQMMRIDRQIKNLMQSLPPKKRYLVTSHDAFNYFARTYLATPEERISGKWKQRVNAPEGLAPESQLSAYEIKQIIDYLKRFNVHLLFPESNVSRDSIRKILSAGKEKGLDLEIVCCPLYGDALGDPGSEGDTYLKMILYDAKLMANYMRGPQDGKK